MINALISSLCFIAIGLFGTLMVVNSTDTGTLFLLTAIALTVASWTSIFGCLLFLSWGAKIFLSGKYVDWGIYALIGVHLLWTVPALFISKITAPMAIYTAPPLIAFIVYNEACKHFRKNDVIMTMLSVLLALIAGVILYFFAMQMTVAGTSPG